MIFLKILALAVASPGVPFTMVSEASYKIALWVIHKPLGQLKGRGLAK